jgi:hypothetical protein
MAPPVRFPLPAFPLPQEKVPRATPVQGQPASALYDFSSDHDVPAPGEPAPGQAESIGPVSTLGASVFYSFYLSDR